MVRSKTTVTERGTAALLNELEILQTAVAQMSAVQAAVLRLVDILGQDVSATPGQNRSTEPAKRWPTYLREWRVSRAKSLDDIGKAVGLSKGQLSRVETRNQPYNQRILESYAEVLGCRPGDLITHAPFQPEQVLQQFLRQLQAARSDQKEVV